MSKKVLVTGSDGFIGSHLVERLVERGYDVKAMVLYNSFDSWGWLDNSSQHVKDSIEVIAGDVRDKIFVTEAMKGCDAVMHLAALIAIPYSYIAPQSYVDVNVTGTLNVVQAARDLGISKVMHTSTSETYGTAQFVPITEEHPLVGQSPYAASKIGADQMALSYYRSFGTPVSVVRPFNTFGPRQSARAVIPTIISQIANGAKQIKLGSLTPTRDLNYVLDTVDGMIAIMESDATLGEVTNIGSGYEITIGDLANLIAEIMGVDIEILTEEQRLRPEKSEVERLWAATEKAERLLDLNPQFSGENGLKKGLALTAEWFQNPENLKHYKTGRYVV